MKKLIQIALVGVVALGISSCKQEIVRPPIEWQQSHSVELEGYTCYSDMKTIIELFDGKYGSSAGAISQRNGERQYWLPLPEFGEKKIEALLDKCETLLEQKYDKDF